MRKLAALFLLALAVPAYAEQRLLPYPSTEPGLRILSAPPSYRRQELLPDPSPRSLGPNAMGDPGVTRVRRHQRLVRPPYPNRNP